MISISVCLYKCCIYYTHTYTYTHARTRVHTHAHTHTCAHTEPKVHSPWVLGVPISRNHHIAQTCIYVGISVTTDLGDTIFELQVSSQIQYRYL